MKSIALFVLAAITSGYFSKAQAVSELTDKKRYCFCQELAGLAIKPR